MPERLMPNDEPAPEWARRTRLSARAQRAIAELCKCDEPLSYLAQLDVWQIYHIKNVGRMTVNEIAAALTHAGFHPVFGSREGLEARLIKLLHGPVPRLLVVGRAPQGWFLRIQTRHQEAELLIPGNSGESFSDLLSRALTHPRLTEGTD